MENGVVPRSGKERQPLLDVTWSSQRLGLGQKFAYGVGHVYNDICAAIWFSYALIFLQLVAGTGPVLAGVLLFLGQFVDAVATPIAGYIVNKGWHKKRWHLLGSLLVSVTFPAVFSICFMCSGVTWAQACYYSVFIILFQSGWALVQIAHLSILPEMTVLAEERASLNAYRYTASMASHIGVYVIAWYFLSKSKGGNMRLIGPADATKFEYIALLSSGIGAVCTVTFHLVLSKKWKEAGPIVETSHQRLELKENLAKFYRSPDLYKVAIIYTSSRLFLTLSLEYMPLFINEVVLSESGTLASVPLVSFLSSAVASMCVKYISRCFGGSRATYFLGCIACIVGCVLIYLNADKSNDTTKIFGSALLFGAGSSITMVVSLCVTANLIGANVECGAFVYSAVTFADKLLNGIAVIIIEYMRCDDTLQCPFYYKDVLAFVNGSVAILGLLVIATLPRRLFITTDNM